MATKRAPLRRVLLGVLIILGGWGLLSSLYQVAQSWKDYERSRNIADWAHDAGQIMTLAQHLSFERGRTAVLLRGEDAVSSENRIFLDERRKLASGAVASLRAKLAGQEKIDMAAFFDGWNRVEALRQQVDRDLALPLGRRDGQLAKNWLAQTTEMLTLCGKIAHELAQYYHQTEEANRLTTLGFLTLKLRMMAGTAASTIVQRLAARDAMTPADVMALYELHGQQEAIWAEIERTVDYLAIPRLKEMATGLKRQQEGVFWPMQERALKAWAEKRPADVTVKELTGASLPVLDGISELMTLATREAMGGTAERMRCARLALLAHVSLAVLLMLVLLLAIRYVLVKVVQPLECVDEKLRHIRFQENADMPQQANEIERLEESAQVLQAMFLEKARLEQELRDMAFYDDLTQLPNRRLMLDRLERSILRAKRDHTKVALLFIDLDRFKPINDEHGHEAGDWLLRAVAERILACIRASDTAARIGGDEFVVILPDLMHAESALPVAEKIRDAIDEPFATPNGLWLEISSSIGMAIYPSHAVNESDLMRFADEAMFRAKELGRNQVAVFPTSTTGSDTAPGTA